MNIWQKGDRPTNSTTGPKACLHHSLTDFVKSRQERCSRYYVKKDVVDTTSAVFSSATTLNLLTIITERTTVPAITSTNPIIGAKAASTLPEYVEPPLVVVKGSGSSMGRAKNRPTATPSKQAKTIAVC